MSARNEWMAKNHLSKPKMSSLLQRIKEQTVKDDDSESGKYSERKRKERLAGSDNPDDHTVVNIKDDDPTKEEYKRMKVDDKFGRLNKSPGTDFSELIHNEGCRSSDLYEKLDKIGEGTYGAVYKARCRETNELMALKKLKLEIETEGFPVTSIRETITLLKGKHPNVIDVREIVFGNRLDQIYIVMEYMDRDLKSLMMDMNRPFKIEEVKLLMQQLLSAIAHLHNNWILHRDLKTSNLLINKGILKVGDFGLAREYGSPLMHYTNKVVTLWYRAPELLLQVGKYSTPIDIWSIGCIFGELLTRKPLFSGQSEYDQIGLIFKALGTPKDELWPDYEQIRLAKKIKLPKYPDNKLDSKLDDKKMLSKKGFDFWNRLLTYNPGVNTKSDPDFKNNQKKFYSIRRITAEEALDHEFFTEEPRPIHPSLFPTWPPKRQSDHSR